MGRNTLLLCHYTTLANHLEDGVSSDDWYQEFCQSIVLLGSVVSLSIIASLCMYVSMYIYVYYVYLYIMYVFILYIVYNLCKHKIRFPEFYQTTSLFAPPPFLYFFIDLPQFQVRVSFPIFHSPFIS